MKRFNKLISVFLAASVLTATAGALEIKPIQEAQTPPAVTDTLSEFLLSKLDWDLSEIASIVETPAAEAAAPIGEAALSEELHPMNEANATAEMDGDEPENTNNEL